MVNLFDILGSVISSGVNYATTKKLNEENAALNQKYWDIQAKNQYKLNEKAADNAQQRTIDLYNLLQSPSAMVKQLKEAFVNNIKYTAKR